jgi:tRNA-specific 2-thiouridylase
LLLKEAGHRVEGITARLWDAQGRSASESTTAARRICRFLHIHHEVVDLREDFERYVLGPFASAYLGGDTPNPCAYCNRDVKLGMLSEVARERDFDCVATGHYAKLGEVRGRITLCEPLDTRKSQVYFLALVNPEILGSLMFPLSVRRKDDVERLGREVGLPARNRESQDLCFVSGRSYYEFLKNRGYVPRPGDVVDTEGNVVGTHKGHAAYTPGQRLGIRGKRYYVVEKHPGSNTIVIGERPQVQRMSITAAGLNLFLPLTSEGSGRLKIRYRYNSPLVGAEITENGEDRITVVTDEPCFAPAPGQVLAGYRDDYLVFGAVIESVA